MQTVHYATTYFERLYSDTTVGAGTINRWFNI